MSQTVEAVRQATGRRGTGQWGSGIRDRELETGNWKPGTGSGPSTSLGPDKLGPRSAQERVAPEAGSWEAVHRVLRYPLYVIC